MQRLGASRTDVVFVARQAERGTLAVDLTEWRRDVLDYAEDVAL
jgi:hypothetical protein